MKSHGVGVLAVACLGLATALFLVARGSDLSTPSTSVPADSPATTSGTMPLTTITTPPVTVPGGLVIRPYCQIVQAKDSVHALASPAGAAVRTFDRLNELKAVTTMLAVFILP